MKLSDLERRYAENDAVLLIRLKNEIDNSKLCKNDIFLQRSYYRFAINEILNDFRETDLPMREVVENYRNKMDEYACEAPEKTKLIFSICYDAATWILDNLLI